MYQTQQTQDELSQLFAQTMTLNPMTPPPESRLWSTTAPEHQCSPSETISTHSPTDQRMVYTSMHYTPTHHVVPVRFVQHTPEATPERQLPLSDEEMIHMLEQNSINPQSLFQSQVHLLRHADSEQRLRLLELWRISPPNMTVQDHQQQQFIKSIQRSGSSMSDETIMPSAPIEIHDRPASAPGTRSSAEPYMASGYEMLARRDYEQSQRRAQQEMQDMQMQQGAALQEIKRYRQATDPAFMCYGYELVKGDQENLGFVSLVENDDMEL